MTQHEQRVILFGDRVAKGNSASGAGVVRAQSQKLELQNQDWPPSPTLGSIRAAPCSAEQQASAKVGQVPSLGLAGLLGILALRTKHSEDHQKALSSQLWERGTALSVVTVTP